MDIEALKSHIYDVVGALYEVHRELGPGLNEVVYQEALAMELKLSNIPFKKEYTFNPQYKGMPLETTYRLDFLCKGDIVIECKSVVELNINHRAQLFNYMRLLGLPSGILVNFATKYAKIERYFYDSERKTILNVYGQPL